MVWEKNGVVLTGKHYHVSSNGALHIIRAEEDRDKGTYRCKSSNVVGTVVSLPAKLGFPCKLVSFTATHVKTLKIEASLPTSRQ